MKPTLFRFLCLLGIVGLLTGACGDDAAAQPGPRSPEMDSVMSDEGSEGVGKIDEPKQLPGPIITAIDFSPEILTADRPLRAIAHIERRDPGSVSVEYCFWRNFERIGCGDSGTLSPDRYRKGDMIHVVATLMVNGRPVSRLRSAVIQVLNSSPEILSVDFPEMRGAGIYRARVHARDVDDDPLTFSLAGDHIPDWIHVDPDSGALIMDLDKHPPERVSFRLVVEDDDDGRCSREVALTFTAPEPQG